MASDLKEIVDFRCVLKLSFRNNVIPVIFRLRDRKFTLFKQSSIKALDWDKLINYFEVVIRVNTSHS